MVISALPVVVEDLTVIKKGNRLLGPIDLKLDGPGLTAVMGPNGSGKTTLLRAMHGLEKTRNGRVNWSCDPILARRLQTFVFQSPVLLRRSAFDNLIYPLKVNGTPQAEAVRRVEDWLSRCRLEKVAGVDGRYLSGGEKQKLAIARALIVEPQVLFVDEPTSSLDGQSTREIEQMLRDAAENGVRIVMATHDIAQAKRVSDSIWFLYRGNLHETGDSKTFFSKPETAEARRFLAGEILE